MRHAAAVLPLPFLTSLLLALLLAAAAARADVGGALSVQTDARDRGLSYSRHHPEAQASVAWDGSTGWYSGAQLTRVRFNGERAGAAFQAYAGGVTQVAPGLDAEAGVLAHHFATASRWDFYEAYAGLLGDRWNVRVYASPRYYGAGQHSVYAEANLRWPVADGWRLLGHAGLMHGRSAVAPTLSPTRLDLRAGVAWSAGLWDVQLAAVTVTRGGPETWVDTSRRRALVLGVSAVF